METHICRGRGIAKDIAFVAAYAYIAENNGLACTLVRYFMPSGHPIVFVCWSFHAHGYRSIYLWFGVT